MVTENHFVGFGGGFSRLMVKWETDDSFTKDSQWTVSLQAVAGISYPIKEYLNLMLGYRLTGMINAQFESTQITAERHAVAVALVHNVELGVRFSF